MIASLLPTWSDRIAAITYMCVMPAFVWALLLHWSTKHTNGRNR